MNNRLLNPICFFFALAFLQGCESYGRVPNIVSCSPAHCLETFPSESIPEADLRLFDALAVLPPSIALDERGLNGEITRELYINEEGQAALIKQLDSISSSYQLTNLPAQTNGVDPRLLIEFEESVWADSPTVEEILSDRDRYGDPRLAKPAQDGPITIPAALSDAAPDNTCCLLLTRLSGWKHTDAAIGTKVAVSSIFGALAGGVASPVTFGQAISDMAVIRIEDGEVLWSGRMLSSGHISQLRATARDYYKIVYESKIAKQMM